VRGTTNPAPALPRSQRPKTAISLHSHSLGGSTGLPEDHNQWNWTSRLHSLGGSTFLITNKLTFDPPTHLLELTQNVTRLSHGHSTPSRKISCKSVQPFFRNVADKETKKERKKSPENNTPSPTGGGVTTVFVVQKTHPTSRTTLFIFFWRQGRRKMLNSGGQSSGRRPRGGGVWGGGVSLLTGGGVWRGGCASSPENFEKFSSQMARFGAF